MLVRRRTPSINPALLLLALLCVFLIPTTYSSVADARMTPPVLYTPDGQGDDLPNAAPPAQTDPQISAAVSNVAKGETGAAHSASASPRTAARPWTGFALRYLTTLIARL